MPEVIKRGVGMIERVPFPAWMVLVGLAFATLPSPTLNAMLGLCIVGWMLHQLIFCAPKYTRGERISIGAMAAGFMMSTPALWIAGTPFDGWSFNVARIGIFGYIVAGGFQRDRHEARNAEALRQARKHLEARAKAARP